MDNLKEVLRQFVQERDWEQFHTPKNIAMALSVEAAELMEPFMWVNGEDSFSLSSEKLAEVKEEIADVYIYLTRLADVLNIDVPAAVEAKIEKNRIKYPADRVRGKSLKYSEYPENQKPNQEV